MINQLPVCVLCQDVISCSQQIDMNLHLIKNVRSQVNKFDAVNKAYIDRIKYETTTGIISNIAMTDHILFTFLAAKAFAREIWVERLADEWIATSCPIFATAWPRFHKFSRGPSL